jgi:hypothetical protein
MKKVMKLSMIALALSLVTACATTSDVENLQSQVDGLNTSSKQASADAASAQYILRTFKFSVLTLAENIVKSVYSTKFCS